MFDIKMQVAGSTLQFFIEMLEMVNSLEEKANDLDLIILPGVSRTGTSVLWQCLDKTFEQGNRLKLAGLPETEHFIWRVANYVIGKYAGATPLLPKSEIDLRLMDILTGPLHDKPTHEHALREMSDCLGMLVYDDVKILKEPMCLFALPTWIEHHKCFRNAKYIWTRRNRLECAKSWVRLKMRYEEYRTILTVPLAKKIIKQHEALLEKIMTGVNHIVVWHEDMINNPDKTFDRISEFVGKEVNTEPFDRGKVWTKSSTGFTQRRGFTETLPMEAPISQRA